MRQLSSGRLTWVWDESSEQVDDHVVEFTCVMDGYPGWHVVPVVQYGHLGGAIIRSVTVRPAGEQIPDYGITTKMLLELRAGDILGIYAGIAQETGLRPDLFIDTRPRETRTGPKGWEPLEYAEWARDYVAAMQSDPVHPIRLLARDKHYSDRSVRDIIRRCRARRMLTDDAKPGRAGGELTDEAIRLLKEAGKWRQ
jgi:hypothetical protein